MRLTGIVFFLFLLQAACLQTACQPASVMSPTATPTTPSVPSAPSVTPKNCPTGDHTEQLTSGGQIRQYRLHVPAAYQPEKPTALLMGFHGADSNSGEFESYSGFSATANLEGFIVVYPQALGQHPSWNTAAGPNNPDIQFVRDLIEEVKERCNIDPNRIYASGHSNGGGMVNRLACDLSDSIAAIGSVSGAYQGSEKCEPARPVAILGIHGTNDPVIPYNGLPSTEEPPALYSMIGIPIPQWASAWAGRNSCDSKPARVDRNDQVTREQWGNCAEESAVVLFTIDGGGHGWPRVFDAAQVIWEFFSEHHR